MINIAATHKKPRPLGEVAPQGDGEGAPKRCEYVILTEQKARTTYDNLLRLIDDPDVRDPIKFLRAREIVHYQRFGERVQSRWNGCGTTDENRIKFRAYKSKTICMPF